MEPNKIKQLSWINFNIEEELEENKELNYEWKIVIYIYNGESVLIDTNPKNIDRINSAFINQSKQEETSTKVNSHIIYIQEIVKSKSSYQVRELVLKKLDCSGHKLNANNIHSIASSESNIAQQINLDLNKWIHLDY